MSRKAILAAALVGATAGEAAPPAEELAGVWGRDVTVRAFMPPLERAGRRSAWLEVLPAPGCGGPCLEDRVRGRAVETRRQGDVWSFRRHGRFYTVVDAMPLLGGHPGVVVTEVVTTPARVATDLPFAYAPARPLMDVDLGTSRTVVLSGTTSSMVRHWLAQAERQGFTMREAGRNGLWRCERDGRQLYIHVLPASGRATALIMDIRE